MVSKQIDETLFFVIFPCYKAFLRDLKLCQLNVYQPNNEPSSAIDEQRIGVNKHGSF